MSHRMTSAFRLLVLGAASCAAIPARAEESLPPPGSGVSAEAYRRVFEGEYSLGYQVSQTLIEKKCWPALRKIVESGKDNGAYWWAAGAYAGQEPRWTAAQHARRVRAWLKEGQSAETLRHLQLEDLIVERDRRLGAELAAEMMASRNIAEVAMGCRLAGLSGDRELAGKLVKIAQGRQTDTCYPALIALASLREAAPIPKVPDRDLVQLAKDLVAASMDSGWSNLVSRLPEAERAKLWPVILEEFRAGKSKNEPWRPWSYFQAPDGVPAWKSGPAEIEVVRGCLVDSDPWVRGVAAYLLGKWEDKPSYEALANLCADQEPIVR